MGSGGDLAEGVGVCHPPYLKLREVEILSHNVCSKCNVHPSRQVWFTLHNFSLDATMKRYLSQLMDF